MMKSSPFPKEQTEQENYMIIKTKFKSSFLLGSRIVMTCINTGKKRSAPFPSDTTVEDPHWYCVVKWLEENGVDSYWLVLAIIEKDGSMFVLGY